MNRPIVIPCLNCQTESMPGSCLQFHFASDPPPILIFPRLTGKTSSHNINLVEVSDTASVLTEISTIRYSLFSLTRHLE